MADLKRLKRLKMAEFAEKLARIRRTCGEGIPEVEVAVKEDADADEVSAELNEVAKEVVECLDTDWDPEAHDRLVARLFGEDYYGAETADDALEEAPAVESDEEEEGKFLQGLDTGDYDDFLPRRSHREDEDEAPAEESALARAARELAAPRKRGKKAQGRSLLRTALERKKPHFNAARFPDFERYFDEFYQLDCEDIISGAGPGDDVHCRFKYREVRPNDFGLSVEEILRADEKELNRWMSVKALSAYR